MYNTLEISEISALNIEELCSQLNTFLSFSPKWMKHTETIGPKNEWKIEDLTEGETYQFRIIAVNKAGKSKPSDPSDNHKAKAKFCTYSASLFL